MKPPASLFRTANAKEGQGGEAPRQATERQFSCKEDQDQQIKAHVPSKGRKEKHEQDADSAAFPASVLASTDTLRGQCIKR